MPTAAEDRAISSAAKTDSATQRLTTTQLKVMAPLRGRPKSENPKLLVSVRYSQEVLPYFKSNGEGWQSGRDGVLHEYVGRQSRREQR